MSLFRELLERTVQPNSNKGEENLRRCFNQIVTYLYDEREGSVPARLASVQRDMSRYGESFKKALLQVKDDNGVSLQEHCQRVATMGLEDDFWHTELLLQDSNNAMKNEKDLTLDDRLNVVLEAEFKNMMANLKNGALPVSERIDGYCQEIACRCLEAQQKLNAMKDEEELTLNDRLNVVLEAEFKNMMANLKNGTLPVSERINGYYQKITRRCPEAQQRLNAMKDEEGFTLNDRLNVVLEVKFRDMMANLKNGAQSFSERLNGYCQEIARCHPEAQQKLRVMKDKSGRVLGDRLDILLGSEFRRMKTMLRQRGKKAYHEQLKKYAPEVRQKLSNMRDGDGCSLEDYNRMLL
jgi:hypothetical protein